MSASQKVFGQTVYRLRQRAQLTQEKLAEKADISTRHVLFIEAGQRSPKVEIIARLKKALGCSWDELMKGL